MSGKVSKVLTNKHTLLGILRLSLASLAATVLPFGIMIVLRSLYLSVSVCFSPRVRNALLGYGPRSSAIGSLAQTPALLWARRMHKALLTKPVFT